MKMNASAMLAFIDGMLRFGCVGVGTRRSQPSITVRPRAATTQPAAAAISATSLFANHLRTGLVVTLRGQNVGWRPIDCRTAGPRKHAQARPSLQSRRLAIRPGILSNVHAEWGPAA
jgi:hypothetical protein